MPVEARTTPESTSEAFSEFLNRGNLEGALQLYDENAEFAVQPGQTVSGHDEIRKALQQFVALRPVLTGRITNTMQAGDVALVCNDWTLKGTAPDGSPVEMAAVAPTFFGVTPRARGCC